MSGSGVLLASGGLALGVFELTVHAVTPPELRLSVILPLLIVIASVSSPSRGGALAALFPLAIVGGIMRELGSALTPGVVLLSTSLVTLLVLLVRQRLLSAVTLRVVLALLFASIILDRMFLAFSLPGSLSPPLVRTLTQSVVIPAVLALPVGFCWFWLLRRPSVAAVIARLTE